MVRRLGWTDAINGVNGGCSGQASIKKHASDCCHAWRPNNWADRHAVGLIKGDSEESASQEGEPEGNPEDAKATSVTPDQVIPEAVPDKATPATEPNQDSVAEATQTTLRKTWKGQQQDADAFARIHMGPSSTSARTCERRPDTGGRRERHTEGTE